MKTMLSFRYALVLIAAMTFIVSSKASVIDSLIAPFNQAATTAPPGQRLLNEVMDLQMPDFFLSRKMNKHYLQTIYNESPAQARMGGGDREYNNLDCNPLETDPNSNDACKDNQQTINFGGVRDVQANNNRMRFRIDQKRANKLELERIFKKAVEEILAKNEHSKA